MTINRRHLFTGAAGLAALPLASKAEAFSPALRQLDRRPEVILLKGVSYRTENMREVAFMDYGFSDAIYAPDPESLVELIENRSYGFALLIAGFESFPEGERGLGPWRARLRRADPELPVLWYSTAPEPDLEGYEVAYREWLYPRHHVLSNILMAFNYFGYIRRPLKVPTFFRTLVWDYPSRISAGSPGVVHVPYRGPILAN